MDSRQIDAVVTSTNYRLAPKCHFPVQFEDVYTALKCFLYPQILERCVDPGRIGISGDSTRGNLDARMTQQEDRETAGSLVLHAAAHHKPSIWGSSHHTEIRLGRVFEDCAAFNPVTETDRQEAYVLSESGIFVSKRPFHFEDMWYHLLAESTDSLVEIC